MDLGKEGELGALALGEGLDFGVRPRLLGPELVAGKTQHLQLVATDHSGQLDCAGRAGCQQGAWEQRTTGERAGPNILETASRNMNME